MNKKKSPERNRIFWKVTCIVLGLILTCMLGGTAYLEHLLNQVNYIEPDAPTPTLSVEEVEEILQEEDCLQHSANIWQLRICLNPKT